MEVHYSLSSPKKGKNEKTWKKKCRKNKNVYYTVVPVYTILDESVFRYSPKQSLKIGCDHKCIIANH